MHNENQQSSSLMLNCLNVRYLFGKYAPYLPGCSFNITFLMMQERILHLIGLWKHTPLCLLQPSSLFHFALLCCNIFKHQLWNVVGNLTVKSIIIKFIRYIYQREYIHEISYLYKGLNHGEFSKYDTACKCDEREIFALSTFHHR